MVELGTIAAWIAIVLVNHVTLGAIRCARTYGGAVGYPAA